MLAARWRSSRRVSNRSYVLERLGIGRGRIDEQVVGACCHHSYEVWIESDINFIEVMYCFHDAACLLRYLT